MSALSLIGQFQTLPIEVDAGGAGDGVADQLLSQVFPVGTYLGSIVVAIEGAGVTTGSFTASFNGVTVVYVLTGANGVSDTASGTFFFTSDGVTPLIVSAQGTGAVWTSNATTLYLRQIA
jgi:hypothetical protein